MWKYKNEFLTEEEIPEGAIGFIYLINNKATGKKYIGKKLLTMASPKKTVKKKDGTISKKKKIQPRKTSNWKNYYGSCDQLTADIKEFGKEKCEREILCFCFDKLTLSFAEAEHQFKNDVLKSENWYNSNIRVRAFKKDIIGKYQ